MSEVPIGQEIKGLTMLSESEWPTQIQVSDNSEVIDVLKPGSDAHSKVLAYLTDRVEMSERQMANFYPRWQVAERKVQAYINLPDWEEELRLLNDKGVPANPVRLTIPYAYSTISTIVAFLMHAFTSRRPMFQVAANKGEAMDSARNMELVLQYNAEHVRLVRHLYQFFLDAETYGLGIMRTSWLEELKMRTRIVEVPDAANGFEEPGTTKTRTRQMALVYSGNEVSSQDPFMFFPDPRVPIADVARRGEFVFSRTFEGRHMLKQEEEAENFKWIDNIPESLPRNFNNTTSQSDRSLITRGNSHAGEGWAATARSIGRKFVQIDQGSVDIIPAELGIGSGTNVEKWMFAMGNKKQIIQAEKMDDDHGYHPVVVAEPYSLGYGFGQPGIADYLGPIQDLVSWYVNSHVDNVRRTLNDIIVVDPSAIEVEDLKKPSPGGIIRLKRAAYGRDVKQVIQQLPINDVTSGHMKDAELMMIVGQRLSAVTDNLAGISQQAGGRRTATEVRTRSEGAISRLASHARLYSAMSMIDLTEQMSLNIQQRMDDDFYLELLGADGARNPISIGPDGLVGDFHYPIYDGTLPLDRIALFEVWTEIFNQVQKDEALRSEYSLGKIFEYIAELGGARNIESFRLNVRPDVEVEKDLQAGNLIPATAGPGADGVPTGRQLSVNDISAALG